MKEEGGGGIAPRPSSDATRNESPRTGAVDVGARTHLGRVNIPRKSQVALTQPTRSGSRPSLSAAATRRPLLGRSMGVGAPTTSSRATARRGQVPFAFALFTSNRSSSTRLPLATGWVPSKPACYWVPHLVGSALPSFRVNAGGNTLGPAPRRGREAARPHGDLGSGSR